MHTQIYTQNTRELPQQQHQQQQQQIHSYRHEDT